MESYVLSRILKGIKINICLHFLTLKSHNVCLVYNLSFREFFFFIIDENLYNLTFYFVFDSANVSLGGLDTVSTLSDSTQQSRVHCQQTPHAFLFSVLHKHQQRILFYFINNLSVLFPLKVMNKKLHILRQLYVWSVSVCGATRLLVI